MTLASCCKTMPLLKNAPICLPCWIPLQNALNLVQKQTCTISECVNVWVELLQKVPQASGGHPLVVERSKAALECPFFLLANLLDFRFQGEKLTTSQVAIAREFATGLGSDVGTAFTMYLAKANPYSEALFSQSSDPISWWKAGLRSGFSLTLTSLALRLCACLASSANLERNFSTMGIMHQSKQIFFPRNVVPSPPRKTVD